MATQGQKPHSWFVFDAALKGRSSTVMLAAAFTDDVHGDAFTMNVHVELFRG